ncbi:interleukin-1 receptor-associated kinase-like 2 [Bombina bombina]|uniref:interleukin-1 receptor-associated kinase-like 2 n=1 Tax=Bombina bombina TaxID=8345 RepID=UPI00235AA1EB|nr:interleukin-1 receptor-associated kinase-like 2 [Bombina bombina]
MERSNATYLIQDIPPRVLEELCSCMDCLSQWEWMRFASRIVDDQTMLRRISLMERTGNSITRELLWYWAQRLATVQNLLTILQDLQLYRAMDILHKWVPQSTKTSPSDKRKEQLSPAVNKNNRNGKMKTEMEIPDTTTSDLPSNPGPKPSSPPSSLLNSLHGFSDLNLVSHSLEALSIPQQECNAFINGSCQPWTREEVEAATNRFSCANVLHQGEFADVFTGRKANKVYAIKRLKEMEHDQQNRVQCFFYTEAQISFRCRHSNLLELLGFCVEDRCQCLIYEFMANGSLDAALQQSTFHFLSWDRRLGIAYGILRAICHLHEAGIFHGNIKSSNVFLDENFSPRLGHSGLRFSPEKFASYRQAKSRDLQRFQPYLPDRFLRSGQLDGQTDIFSLGVVLAELLTGLRACEEGRTPVYLKDLIMEESEMGKSAVECSEKWSEEKNKELQCVQRLSQKYLDHRAGKIPENAAFCFATAVNLCLTKKKPLLLEVCRMIERANHHYREWREGREQHKGFQKELSTNVPEESDDGSSFSICTEGAISNVPASVSDESQFKHSVIPKVRNTEAACRDPESIPCEFGSCYVHEAQATWDQANRGIKNQQHHEQHKACENSENSTPDTDSESVSWGIQVNEQKRQLMLNISLYEDEKLDSSVLFDST